MTVWYEKYRPTTLDDYVWTDEATHQTLLKWIDAPLEHPSLILHGPTGTGKTTLAKIIRKMLDLGGDAMFIPSSLESGVETIRNKIVNFCEAGGFGGMKLIIFDEADRLSQDAQDMMRNVMDRYQEDVRFIFTCNRIGKIIDPVKGRMWAVEVHALDETAFVERLIDIVAAEQLDIDPEVMADCIDGLVAEFYPNLRTAISYMQRKLTLGLDGKNTSVELDVAIPALFDNFSMDAARSLVATMRPDDYEDAYRYLYENSSMFGDNEFDAVVVIAEQLFRHSQAGLPDITLAACLLKLQELGE